MGLWTVHTAGVEEGHEGVFNAVSGHVVLRLVHLLANNAEGGMLEEVGSELVAGEL